MKINYIYDPYISKHDLEVVERKGIGHPDTLADLVAEEFSTLYVDYCVKNFGVVLNYWVDKITLMGGEASVSFGKGIMNKKIGAYLFGKVTNKIGDSIIDVYSIFKESVKNIFGLIFGKEILNYIEYHVDITQAIGAEYDSSFYAPKKIEDLLHNDDMKKSTDTIVCTGSGPYTFTESLAINLENYINSSEFKGNHNYTGWDVKVMITRFKNNFDITLCIPFIASLTPDFSFYSNEKHKIYLELIKFLDDYFRNTKNSYNLNLNTKDYGEYGYLTVFGTALDKGDAGAVGRGNKYSGVISNIRDNNVEAVSGKSITRHGGKIYTIFAFSLAHFLSNKLDSNLIITIVTNNGNFLNSPSGIFVSYDKKNIDKNYVSHFINNALKGILEYRNKLSGKSPIAEHISKSIII